MGFKPAFRTEEFTCIQRVALVVLMLVSMCEVLDYDAQAIYVQSGRSSHYSKEAPGQRGGAAVAIVTAAFLVRRAGELCLKMLVRVNCALRVQPRLRGFHFPPPFPSPPFTSPQPLACTHKPTRIPIRDSCLLNKGFAYFCLLILLFHHRLSM